MQRLTNYLNHSPFFIRLLHWEYWPFTIVQAPVFIYYLWLSVKARSLFFFSAANPSIETGGMFGESKWNIFGLLPGHVYPKTIFISEGTPLAGIKNSLKVHNICYPFIAKPDRGERGWNVAKIENEEQLVSYITVVKVDFLIQEYADLPVELSVFYYRYPGAEKGIVSSVVIKEMLAVTGNGYASIRQLIMDYPRALLQLHVLETTLKDKLDEIPGAAERVELVPIGNHSRGAKFIDGCFLIDEALCNVFNTLGKSIPGFHYGRFDLRCKSIDDLKQGVNIQILELNGAGAEPAHIYQPGFSLFKAYSVLFHHFSVLYEISRQNNRLGVAYMTYREFISFLRITRNYKQKAGGK
jgi:hypothetical protein